jgi:hypothetical protein
LPASLILLRHLACAAVACPPVGRWYADYREVLASTAGHCACVRVIATLAVAVPRLLSLARRLRTGERPIAIFTKLLYYNIRQAK